MSFDPFFSDILICPLCHASLEVYDTMLACKTCASAFPVKENIPFLIPEEARPLGEFCSDQP